MTAEEYRNFLAKKTVQPKKKPAAKKVVNPTMGHGGEVQPPKVWRKVDVRIDIWDKVEQAEAEKTECYSIAEIVSILNTAQTQAHFDGKQITIDGVISVVRFDPDDPVIKRMEGRE